MKLLKNAAILGLGIVSLILGSGPSEAGPSREGWISQGWPQWHPQKGKRPLANAGTQLYFGEETSQDSDGDGVPDSIDECPDTPKGTKVDAKGCPIKEPMPEPVVKRPPPMPEQPPVAKVVDGDDDGDGVLNSKDRCPNTPKSATVTSEGCWVIKNVNFKTDRWDIPASAHSSLNEVVKVLKQNPGLNFEIQGHTDNRLGPKHNNPLSNKRAKAVKDYLVKHGVSANRLTSKGLGQSHPIANNKTNAGRAENRRVELIEVR
ncbi:MAG: OmpA family protein [Magnetococcales bacterium]|nr:OmpA family protein [Magnetococcales bacterium]